MVWIWHADLDRVAVADTLYPLSADEIERTRKFRTPQLQRRFAAGRALLRRALSRMLDVEPRSIRFKYGPFGKPSLDVPEGNETETLHFNLSHSQERMVLAVSRHPDIGIDIEKTRRIPDEEQIAKRFFQSEEYSEYLDLPSPLRHQGFLNAWTRKEAILKARGEGLHTPLDSFQVSLDPRASCRLRRFHTTEDSVSSWTLHGFNPIANTTAAIAVRATSLVFHLSEVPSDLLDEGPSKPTTANPSVPCLSLLH